MMREMPLWPRITVDVCTCGAECSRCGRAIARKDHLFMLDDELSSDGNPQICWLLCAGCAEKELAHRWGVWSDWEATRVTG